MPAPVLHGLSKGLMHFNPEINLGTIVEMATLVIIVAGGMMRLGRLEAKLNIMFEWFQSAIIRRGGPDLDDIRRFHGDK